MRLLITPQIYFDNPYHYQFETYDLLRFNNKSLEYAVDEYITNDLIESYNQVNNLHILQSGTWTFEEIELIQNFESASSMKYFIIDWYFIYSKLSSQYSKNSNAEIEFDTRIFIEEIFEFLSPDHNYNFTKDEFYASQAIIKLNNIPRNINQQPVDTFKQSDFNSFFINYKNLEPYEDNE